MHQLSLLLALASSSLCTASQLDAALLARAFPNSPSEGYPPSQVECPANRPAIREASALSANETDWLPLRRNQTIDPMIDFLNRMGIPDFDAGGYITANRDNASALPNIALAFSGGGWRALQNGAGFLAAADNRTTNATARGGIGGLLQASTYIAGLSGGSWLVGSMYINNFTKVTDLRDSDRVWDFSTSVLEGPDSKLQVLSTGDYLNTIRGEVDSKRDAGFDISITDYWGRALSYQLINAMDGGPAYTWSSIAEDPAFLNGDMPLPLVVADGRAPGTLIVSLNSTVFEFNPWELGSWEPSLAAFAPLKYLGSNFSAGSLPSSEQCVAGFDQAGFVMGTSSSLFSTFLTNLDSTSLPEVFKQALQPILADLSSDDYDIARYNPNPFYNYNSRNGTVSTNSIASSDDLDLVDGGLDNQNIPLNPLIQPMRSVDVIFAIDSSADTNLNWPNGSSLVQTYQRALDQKIENGTPFPVIPGHDTFINLGLNNRPTFFGCDASNVTAGTNGVAPLIVYIPNAPYIVQSNVSTFQPTYNNTFRNAIIQNGYDVATLGNGTLDSDWTACVACAVLSRSFDRTAQAVPSKCQQCFERYCWNGTIDANPATYEPAYKLQEVNVSGGKKKSAAAPSGHVCWSALAGVAIAVGACLW